MLAIAAITFATLLAKVIKLGFVNTTNLIIFINTKFDILLIITATITNTFFFINIIVNINKLAS